MDMRAAILGWCGATPLALKEQFDDPDGYRLQVLAFGRETVEVEVVYVASAPNEITVGHIWNAEVAIGAVPAENRAGRLAILQRLAEDVSLARPGRLVASAQFNDETSQVAILCPLDADGLNRNTFLAAVADVGKARRQIERAIADVAAYSRAGEGTSAAVPPVTAVSALSQNELFDVVLVDPGDAKVQVIKEIRELTGAELAAAKDLVDGTPATIASGVGRNDAGRIAQSLEAAGGKVAVRPRG